jgi:hypothetical protein
MLCTGYVFVLIFSSNSILFVEIDIVFDSFCQISLLKHNKKQLDTEEIITVARMLPTSLQFNLYCVLVIAFVPLAFLKMTLDTIKITKQSIRLKDVIG